MSDFWGVVVKGIRPEYPREEKDLSTPEKRKKSSETLRMVLLKKSELLSIYTFTEKTLDVLLSLFPLIV